MKVVFEHPHYDRDRTVKVGFSWLILLLGPLVPLFRGNFKWFAIIIFGSGAAHLLGWGTVGAEWGGFLFSIPLSIWFAWIFNEQHRAWLWKKGWTKKDGL